MNGPGLVVCLVAILGSIAGARTRQILVWSLYISLRGGRVCAIRKGFFQFVFQIYIVVKFGTLCRMNKIQNIMVRFMINPSEYFFPFYL